MIFKIRKATYKDSDVLDSLFAKLIENEQIYDDNIKDNLTMKGFFSKRINEEENIILVVEDNDNIVGYIYGYIRADNKIKKELEAYIESLFIINEYRNQGLATNLINKFIEEAKKLNTKYIFIENKKDNIVAKKLYDKLNFNNFIEHRRKEI